MNTERKVLVLNPYIATLGGGEKHMGYFCKCIENYYNNQVKIEILVFNSDGVDVFADNYVTVDDINRQFALDLKNTHIKKINLPHSNNYLEYLKNKREVENITKEYDVFVNFMFLSKHIGKAKINIYQCMFPPTRYAKQVTGKKRLLAMVFDFLYFRSYNVFISNSAYTNHWLGTYWKNSRKNKIIYPPVFSEKEITGRYDESRKKNIIVSVGRFFVGSHSKKQLELVQFFVHNVDAFKDYEYHVVGAVSQKKEDQEYLSKIKELAGKVGNVFIHENCQYEFLIDLYEQAKIFWHGTGYGIDENKEPEKMEHFGITTVEAMSFGVVPVVINKGGQKETVEEGVNGFRWDNEKECVEKTQILIDNDNLRKKMAEVSARRANDYSIEEFERKNREVFHEISM